MGKLSIALLAVPCLVTSLGAEDLEPAPALRPCTRFELLGELREVGAGRLSWMLPGDSEVGGLESLEDLALRSEAGATSQPEEPLTRFQLARCLTGLVRLWAGEEIGRVPRDFGGFEDVPHRHPHREDVEIAVAAHLLPDFRDLFYGERRLSSQQVEAVLEHLREVAEEASRPGRVRIARTKAASKELWVRRTRLLQALLRTELPMSLRVRWAREPKFGPARDRR